MRVCTPLLPGKGSWHHVPSGPRACVRTCVRSKDSRHRCDSEVKVGVAERCVQVVKSV